MHKNVFKIFNKKYLKKDNIYIKVAPVCLLRRAALLLTDWILLGFHKDAIWASESLNNCA